MKKKINRRKFVKKAAAGVAATAALASCTTWGPTQNSVREPNNLNKWTPNEEDRFDFIIVGSGAGGGPLAARLARAGYVVLLLEAGAHETKQISTTPVFHAKASDDPLLNWSYFVKQYGDNGPYGYKDIHNSKYQPNKKGIYYPRATGIGGCTRVNALISLYPDHQDWANFSKTFGLRSPFTPEEMKRVFKGMQKENGGWIHFSQANPETLIKDRFLTKMALAALAVDGVDAKGTVQDFLQKNRMVEEKVRKNIFGNALDGAANVWNEATSKIFKKVTNNPIAKKAFDIVETLDGVALEGLRKAIYEDRNFKLNPNHDAYIDSTDKQNGVFNIPFNATNGVRKGVREFLLETEEKFSDRLFIKTQSMCTKIIFDPNDKTKAIGIEFIEGASAYSADLNHNPEKAASYTKKNAFAKREVILSGGAYNTPQLLMLSGIGNEKEIQQVSSDIKMVKNLPGVGKNLQDRYEVTVVSELNEPLSVIKDCSFVRNNEFEKDECWKDYVKAVQAGKGGDHLYGTNGVALSLIRKSSPSQPTPDLCIFGLPGYFKGYYPRYSDDTTPKKEGDPNYFTWAILKGHTKNHAGEVKLKSDDPKDTPDIHFKYFHDNNNGLVEDLNAVLQGVKVARDINSKIGEKYFKREVQPNLETDKDINGWIMREAWGHHASCTNKMGVVTDPMAVVDERFRVHGIKNLRVVDASVFPDIPGLFIMLPTLMMSERAFELIHEEHRRKV